MEILTRPYVNIKADLSSKTIILRWSDHCPSADYRHGLESAREAVQEHKLIHWMADLRNMGVILHAD